MQLDEVRQLYRELHAQVERLTECHEDSSQKVIDAVAEHHKKQSGFLQGGWVGLYCTHLVAEHQKKQSGFLQGGWVCLYCTPLVAEHHKKHSGFLQGGWVLAVHRMLRRRSGGSGAQILMHASSSSS